MDNYQIEKILRSDSYTRKRFLGVFPSDKIPKKIKKTPTCFIVNVDSSKKPGSHWVAFYVHSPNLLEFFDSYGNPPSMYPGPIEKYAAYFDNVESNPLRLQSLTTKVCGQYCIYYLYSKCRGKNLKKILSVFGNSLMSNDKKVHRFVTKHFRVRTPFM